MTTEIQAAAAEIAERDTFREPAKMVLFNVIEVLEQAMFDTKDLIVESPLAVFSLVHTLQKRGYQIVRQTMSEEELSREAKLICHLTCQKGPVFDEVKEQIEDLAKRYAGEI